MLADTHKGIHPKFRPPYMHMLPLAEIIQLSLGTKNTNTKAVQSKWADFVGRIGNEIHVLVDAKEGELREVDDAIAKKIIAFRNGLVLYIPGGGGQYGTPIICDTQEELARKEKELAKELSGISEIARQRTLAQFG